MASNDNEPPYGWEYVDSIQEQVKAHPELSPAQIGGRMTARMTKGELRPFAAHYIAGWADTFRRNVARKVEASATGSQTNGRSNPTPSPAALVAGRPAPRWPDKPWYVGNRKERDDFRSRLGSSDFESWHTEMTALVEAAGDPAEIELFAEDWWPGGVRARQRFVLAQGVYEAMVRMADSIRLEITDELLSTEFALGDGSRINWGAATVDQHQHRIETLMSGATGTVETAARHLAAIRRIEAANAVCLSDARAATDDEDTRT